MTLFFDSIKIKSFLSVDEINLDLRNLGLTLVRGINKYEPKFESNGSGKSSLFDSIIWCLLGYTTRDVNHVTNENSDVGASVELSLRINSDDFKIIRTENPKILKIYQNGEDISGTTYTKSQAILNEKLGWISYDTLISIVILSQGLPGRFTSLKPKDRKYRLECLSGIDGDIEVLIDRVNKRLSEFLNDKTSVTRKLAEITGSISSNQQSIRMAESKIQELSQIVPISAEEYSKLKSEYESQQRLISDINSDILKLNSELNEFNRKYYKYNSELSMNRKYQEESQSQLLSYLDSKCPTCGSIIDCTDKILEKKKRILDLDVVIEDLESNLKVSQTRVAELTSEISERRTLMQKLSDSQPGILQKLRDYEQTQNSISVYQQTIDTAAQTIAELTDSESQLRNELSSLDKLIEIANYYKTSTAKKFRTYLLDEVLKFMNSVLERLSKYLYQVQGVVRLVASGNDIKIYLGDREFGALSGGEGRRVDLILQLAQRQLCEVQSGFSCNLLVIDEILDYLDAIGVDNVLSLLESNSTSVESLMLVTHRPDLNVMFDNVITVVKDSDQMSRLSQE